MTRVRQVVFFDGIQDCCYTAYAYRPEDNKFIVVAKYSDGEENLVTYRGKTLLSMSEVDKLFSSVEQ